MNSPPHVAILGGGPIGLEAALAAVDAGLTFTLYEAGADVGANVASWGHVRLFTPWEMNIGPRMSRHLRAAGWTPPPPQACPAGAEVVARLLRPVAELPAVGAGLRTSTEVLEVGREGLLKNEEIGTGERARHPFRILLRDGSGREWVEHAAVVLDCTGTYHNPNALGEGGIHAPGERAAERFIIRSIPDVAGRPEEWKGLRILLVGGGHSAQTAARDLAELCRLHPDTRVTWAVRNPDPSFGAVADDPLPERRRLTRTAAELAQGGGPIEVRTGYVVDRLQAGDDDVAVTLRSATGPDLDITVDRIVALTGSVGDASIYRQLQVHECYATSGPMKLAAALLGSGSADCLTQESHGADTLRNPEPGFFILGSKSYGRNNTFLLRTGYRQVDEVFALLEAGTGVEVA